MLSVDEVGLEAAVGQLAQELEQAGVGCQVGEGSLAAEEHLGVVFGVAEGYWELQAGRSQCCQPSAALAGQED